MLSEPSPLTVLGLLGHDRGGWWDNRPSVENGHHPRWNGPGQHLQEVGDHDDWDLVAAHDDVVVEGEVVRGLGRSLQGGANSLYLPNRLQNKGTSKTVCSHLHGCVSALSVRVNTAMLS